MLLNELFKKIAKWKWVKNDPKHAVGGFIIGEQLYQVKFFGEGNKTSVEFTSQHVDDTYDGAETISATGNGNQYEVFGTVLDIIHDYVETNNKTDISFTGSGDTRIKLYRRMIATMERKGWTLADQQDTSKHGKTRAEFRLTKGE